MLFGLLTVASLFLSATAQCQCGTGYDYGCDQRKCGIGATCLQGHCNQDGLDSPTCDGGDCSQINATNASCEPGNCCPPLADGTCLKSVAADCIGEDVRVYSCSSNMLMPVREISMGDSIRALSSNGELICSDVYYIYKHKAKGTAYVIQVAGQDEDIVLSPNHLLYVGNNFGNRNAVLAKNLREGDVLVSSDPNDLKTKKVVLSIQAKASNLVNILTFDSAIELEGGVVISAYSFNELLYSYVFWPFALSYKYFGSVKFETILSDPMLEMIDEHTHGIMSIAASFLSRTMI